MSRSALRTDRRLDLDVLRILSSFFVVMIHVCTSCWTTIPVDSFGWQCLNLLNTLARASVPIFVMISGALFLQREQPMRKIVRKNIVRLLVLYGIWALFYALDTVGFSALMSFAGWKALAVEFLTAKYHLWFLQSTVAAYVLLPLLWALVRHADGRYVPYVCAVYLLGSVISTLFRMVPLSSDITGSLTFFLPTVGYFPALMLLGYFLFTAPRRQWETPLRLLLLWAALVLLTAAANSLLSLAAGEPNAELLRNSSPAVVLCACPLFRCIHLARLPESLRRRSGLIGRLSACTTGIYLLHVFVLEHLRSWCGIRVEAYPVALSVPLLALLIFLLSLGITALLRRIPAVGRWIV